jgi:hypothetical protein
MEERKTKPANTGPAELVGEGPEIRRASRGILTEGRLQVCQSAGLGVFKACRFVRIHSTCKTMPEAQHGLARRPWSIEFVLRVQVVHE